ncbi:hypothetical protein K7432_002725 [Basidiobolus ranarum]|uniref:Proline-rich protein PRCC n=1 Tax=Basidiobolus ranarum TaxID=34480 RepID=A0ABR2W7C2_9FUNG
MSLVADYGSESEEYSEEENYSSKSKVSQPQIAATKKKTEGSLKFIVDLPTYEEEEPENENKPKGLERKPGKSSLFSMLPQPKNSSTSVKTDLTPPSVSKVKPTKKPLNASKQVVSNKVNSTLPAARKKIEEESEPVPTSFFPMDFKQKKPIQTTELEYDYPVQNVLSDKPAGPELAPVEYTAASMYAYDNTNPYYQDPSMYSGYEYQDPNYYNTEDQSPEDTLDEEAITQLMGRRAGKEQASSFNITTINQQDQLQDANIPSKMSAGSSGRVLGAKPSGNQKRRHNIMYLAFQAKEREEELQEYYALNKKTKKETQGKYGF